MPVEASFAGVGPSTAPTRLCRLLLVRAGSTQGPREQGDPAISDAGRREIAALRRHWEWADHVVASPLRRARESARILCRDRAFDVDPRLRPIERGRYAGLAPEALRAEDPVVFEEWVAGSDDAAFPHGETRREFRLRVREAFAALASGLHASVLVIGHRDGIREIAAALTGAPLPAGRPAVAELALMTRGADGRWRPGRRSSDPPPLRSELERTGLSGVGGRWDGDHVGSLELRTDR
jgi:broad specificity phosphatase PhoE